MDKEIKIRQVFVFFVFFFWALPELSVSVDSLSISPTSLNLVVVQRRICSHEEEDRSPSEIKKRAMLINWISEDSRGTEMINVNNDLIPEFEHSVLQLGQVHCWR